MFKVNFVVYLLLLCFLISCSEFARVQKKGDQNEKLAAAFRYYEKKDYYRATVLFDDVMPVLKGRKEGEKALFYFANSYYHQKQYELSSYYYRDFYETFPRSEFTEEAMFMYAKSLYKMSPEYNLDQTNTYETLRAIQRFANRYPKSAYMDEANKITDELNAKLEKKAYENAKQYFNLSEFNSAYFKSSVVVFENFLNRYPNSRHAEEILYLKVVAQYNLAMHSEHSKQRERYFEAIEFYHNFIDKYPQSKYKKQAEEIYDNTLKKLEQLKI
jgi:outer membrane protein assembly factor BamD